MAAGKRVLVTGADGLVGGIVMNRLHDRYDLRPLTGDLPAHRLGDR
jgi:nucleoside-diphosphate-sugar epimerase